MARVIGKTKAVVLRTRRMGETSKLVTLYTEEFGKLSVTAKGARRPKSKFGAGLDLMAEIQAVCYIRDDRDLHTLSDCDLLRTFPGLLNDIQKLSYGSAACEMIDRLTIDGEPTKRLYRCLSGVLAALEEVESSQLESLFWYFQLRAAEALGYRPELAHCANCGSALGGAAWLPFSPAMGGAMCSSCGSGTGGGAATDDVAVSDLTLSAPDSGFSYGQHGSMGSTMGQSYRVARNSISFLAGLQHLKTYGKEAIPPAPSRKGEIRGMLRRILEYHGGQSGRLRSLEFLESVNRFDTVVN